MAQSFSLARAPHADGEDPAWRAIIRSQTGSDAETDSILRSIARFGNGAGIQRYEITPVERRGQRASRSVTWTVSAVRQEPWTAGPTPMPFGGGSARR
ncbi:MAG: hypothetical protein R3E98_18095 [Gemmatimonadota bacterium]|nr:hypothetical protein [Gemmatimonadota bacterium]